MTIFSFFYFLRTVVMQIVRSCRFSAIGRYILTLHIAGTFLAVRPNQYANHCVSNTTN